MTNKWLKVALMVTAIATGTSINIDAETVLYVPQDDRPVSLQYTVDTAREAGMTVLTPPQHLISGKTYQGQADQIMAWVEQNAGRADVMVLSTDTLIYGMSLQASVPVEYLQDWFDRRQKNMKINKELIDETRSGVFDYFALGHDDTSQLSQSALEGRYLNKYSKDISVEKYGSFPGADQLGLLLMARSRTDVSTEKPTFSVIYPLGGGGKTLPGYEDQTIDKTIAQHVEAVGGTMVTQGKPTVLLAVNTPLTTSTGESENFENFPMISNSTNAFVDRIQQAVDSGVNVSVADIAFNNG
ncbi:MAG: DUF4127 family protein, partial [Veillonella sp.]|nr:DUF4127 family protein [Veillonella sp.]